MRQALKQPLVRVTALLGVFYALDKVIGLGRGWLVARAYGVGAELDAFNAANNLPDTLFTLISGGALALALIPVLSQALTQGGRPAMWRLFALTLNVAFSITAGLAVLMALFTPALVAQVVAPGFTPEQQALTVNLMRLNLLGTLIFSISGLVMGALQANQRFLAPALAPLAYDLGQILGLLALGPTDRLAVTFAGMPGVGAFFQLASGLGLNLGIYGLAYGVIGGAALHLLVQLPMLWRLGFRWQPLFDLRDPGLRAMLALMGPRVLTVAGFSGIYILNDSLASGFEAGAITALALGWQAMQIPQTLIGTAAGTALLPTLGELAAQGEHARLQALVRRALLTLTALTLPLTGAAWLALPLVVPLVFGAENAPKVVIAGQFFMLGLVGHTLKEVTARVFYAYQRPLMPLLTVSVNLLAFAGLAHLLMPGLGFAALALANSLSFSLEVALMLALLRAQKLL